MELTFPTLAAGIGIICSLLGLHYVVTRDYRERLAEMEKRYLVAEQGRMELRRENIELLQDLLGQRKKEKGHDPEA